jgi:flavodoxin I
LSIVPSGFSSYLCAQFRTGHEDAHARQSASKLALLSLNRIIAPNYNIIKRLKMNSTIVVYGSSTGTCEAIAEKIAQKLGCEAINVQDLTADVVNSNQNLILGTSTWGAGEMQDDWYDGLKVLKAADLSGKTIALFGCGDCESYGDTFVGGIGELYNGIKSSGATFVGAVDTDGYSFDDSEAVIDGKFIGLPLDDVNEDDKTDTRIDAWIANISPNL